MILPFLLGAALALPPAPDDAAATGFADALRAMDAVADGLQDATFTMHKREWVSGGQGSWSVVDVKFRRAEDAYMVFTDGPNEGREVLWRGPDWNEGKFKVDPGRFIPVLNLDPNGSMAMRGNRHNIRELPPTLLIEKIVADAMRVNDSPIFKPDVTDLGAMTVRGEDAHCWEANLPKDMEDGKLRLVEEYDYLDLKVNPGLTDADFDPDTYGL